MAGNPRELQIKKRRKERVRKTKRKNKAYIQARPRNLSYDQHVIRHTSNFSLETYFTLLYDPVTTTFMEPVGSYCMVLPPLWFLLFTL